MEEKSRIQKILAASGVASRRKAEELLSQGRVTVNGSLAGAMIVRSPGLNDDSAA